MINEDKMFARLYLVAEDFEKYMTTKLGSKFKDKPIVLSKVNVGDFDRSVEFEFDIISDDNIIEADNKCLDVSEFSGDDWSVCRTKGSTRDMFWTMFKQTLNDNDINQYLEDESGEPRPISDVLRELADKIDEKNNKDC